LTQYTYLPFNCFETEHIGFKTCHPMCCHFVFTTYIFFQHVEVLYNQYFQIVISKGVTVQITHLLVGSLAFLCFCKDKIYLSKLKLNLTLQLYIYTLCNVYTVHDTKFYNLTTNPH
jgi:hypothetical protein